MVYATHIFDQADKWATHVAFMQLDKKLSPVHKLHDYAPYQEILARTGADRAMCPMYVLVLGYFSIAGAGPWSVDEQVLGGELEFYEQTFENAKAKLSKD